jgi:hypothetical protein
MNQVSLTFSAPGLSDYTLFWEVLAHKPASIWIKLVQHELIKGDHYFFRFTGFLNNQKTEESLLRQLQDHINFINEDNRYYIIEKAEKFDQEFANKIHHHFEILAGSFDMPALFYKQSSIPVREAIQGLNHCIHDLEALARNTKYKDTEWDLQVFSGVILEIKNCYRAFIPASFYKYFSLELEFGDMVLHYSQIGKTWLEAFYDSDDEIFESGIRPQYALSGEFDILFGNLFPDQAWKNRLEKFLASKGKNISDPNLRLGHLPVARLRCSGQDLRQIKTEVGLRSQVRRIQVLNDHEVLAEKSFF